MVRLQPQGGALKKLARIIAACVVSCAGASAVAQMVVMEDALSRAALPDGRRPGVQLEFGFQKVLVADRWGPLRVILTGGDQPIDGVVQLEYTGRRSGSSITTAPFAVGPDQSAPVDIAVPFDDWFSAFELKILDSRARTLRRFRFEDWSDVGFERAPEVLPERQVVVGVVGPTTIDIAERNWARIGATLFQSTQPGVNATTDQEDSQRSAQRPEVLPVGAQTRIVRMDVSALPPLHSSYDMLSGLIIAGDAIDQLNRSVVASILRWVESGGRLALVLDQPGTDVTRWLGADVLDVEPTPSTQPTGRHGRSMSVTDPGRSLAWRVADSANSGAGVPIADGPFGLGWMVVVGASPTEAVVEEADAASAWGAVLEPLVGDRARAIPANEQNQWRWWQGAGRERSALLNALAGDLENVRSIGFWPIFLILLALGALLGPVDYVVLKKRAALHRSWITSLCWIGVFTALGAVAPNVLRSAETQLRRISAVDVASGVSCGASVTGVFAGSSGGVSLEGVDRASRWRPTMVGGATTFGGALSIVRTTEGGAVPIRLPLRRWTFLTVLDEVVAADAPRVNVRDNGRGCPDVRLENLSGGVVRSAVVYTREGWITLEPADEDGWMCSTDELAQENPPAHWRPEETPDDEPWMWMNQASSNPQYEPSLIGGLPGVDARLDLLRRRVQRGEGVLVMVDIVGDQPSVTAREAPNQSQRTIYRILAPLQTAPPAQEEVGP